MRLPAASVSLLLALPLHAATIAVDVGHSLGAPGATSAYGEPEFFYNRALAQEVARRLRGAGHLVLLIGADGEETGLRPRPELAAAARADLFLSIHHDSAQQRFLKPWTVDGVQRWYTDFSGYSLFVSRQNPRFAASAACAQAISRQLQSRGFQRTLHHTAEVAGEGRPLFDRALGVYEADFAVLRHASMPAVLFEAGVILNRDDALRLARPATRTRLAEAVAAAAGDCLAAH
ncbi:N-acetylmuramoyl-L-alanine amidase [Chitiniphilus shinanonensis]|uniref:N-acetylmuramoyl-L-alanine amidase n=1 Tax=Chitiniphilus shinanonensis TaxID=553088 RepID=A0ABQ6BRH9_9NEIS|nr:N-acetylmuramoyl-L-alanine amidase [Chitiniphilus shinanonensis]GLS04605.1 N-acetylmuramoyl-L-alanine amidase [Chitiniphilus shinanonensis]